MREYDKLQAFFSSKLEKTYIHFGLKKVHKKVARVGFVSICYCNFMQKIRNALGLNFSEQPCFRPALVFLG